MAVVSKNPILQGFYPDPSICAVGDDFYLVNSTFSYFPGLPVMHSKDLANWEQIGNVMERESQLPLEKAGHSQGLFAPTIRYNENDGLFYVICTNVSYGGNFIVTATEPGGPWSEPHYIEGADGIDPSLFFDEDGKCYYIGTHENPEGCKYNGDYYIYIQELDIKNFKFVGERKNVWNGAMRDICWPEGPHLYKIEDYYYIIHAEGGTGPNHAICCARSKEVFGPYENNFNNPIFTHRHLGKRYPVQYVGHGDLFKTSTGEWYMVMLAVRPTNGFTMMGRETFLAKVFFEDGWPLVNPGLGVMSEELKINLEEYCPEVIETSLPNKSKVYNFAKMSELGPEWLALRKSYKDFVSFDNGLLLKCGTDNMIEDGHPSFVAIRQDSKVFEARTTFYTDNLFMGARAGLCYMQSNRYQLRFEVSENLAKIILVKDGVEEMITNAPCNLSPVTLVLKVSGTRASMYLLTDKGNVPLVRNYDVSALSTEIAGGFVGCTVGIFATDGEDREAPVKAKFTSFKYDRITKLEEETV